MRAREPDSSGYVVSDGVRLAWESFNDEAPTTVMFVPIDTCVHSRAWKGQVAYLAQHVRVVTVDPPGNGRSGRARMSVSSRCQRSTASSKCLRVV